MAEYAILENGTVTEVDSVTFFEWLKTDKDFIKRRVEYTEFDGYCTVSTVFLGLNHQFRPNAPPLWFETLVFGGLLDGEMERYTTIEAALAGHTEMVKRVQLGAIEHGNG